MRDWFVLGQTLTPSTAPSAPATPVEGTAVTVAPGTQPAPATQAKGPDGFMGLLMNLGPIILIFALLYFFMFRGQRKEEKKRKAMLSELKKGDRIMTIGGLKGSVVEIREADDEVLIKIDESNNTKARFVRSAIQKVIDTDTKVDNK